MEYPRGSSSLMRFLLLVAHFQASLQLVIKNVNIPAEVKAGEEFVILDCDYDLGKTSSKGLVVKWYLNNFDLVYQWIQGSAPQAIDPTSKYIDFNYKASNDPNTMYRAMKLIRPGIDLSGNYTCLISTFENETSAKGPMMVYSIGRKDKFKLWLTNINTNAGEIVNVKCQAEGLYPKPKLRIVVEGLPKYTTEVALITERANGHYDIDTYTLIKEHEIPDCLDIKCILEIPDINYNASKNIMHCTEGNSAGDIRTNLICILMYIAAFIVIGY